MPAPITKFEPITPDQKTLVESCVKLAYLIVNRFQRATSDRYDKDEVLSRALFTLIRCAVNYQPGRVGPRGIPSKFSSYAANSISKHLFGQIRRNLEPRKGFLRAVGRLPTNEKGMEQGDLRFVSNDERTVRKIEASADVARYLGALSEVEAAVIVRRFGLREFDVHNVDETAKALGISKFRVVETELAAVTRMREFAAAEAVKASGHEPDDVVPLPTFERVTAGTSSTSRDCGACRHCGSLNMRLRNAGGGAGGVRATRCLDCRKHDRFDRVRADRPKTSADKVAAIASMAATGASLKEISEATGVRPRTVQRYLSRLEHGPVPRPKTPLETFERVCAALKEGGLNREIAARCGVCTTTVSRIKKQLRAGSQPASA